MASLPERRIPTRLVLDASRVARAHTVLAFAAFLSALFLGCALHYKKIVKNGVAGYPEEWFPSVSATIGDWYPERNIFQILIALNSGPRLALAFLQYYLHRNAASSLPGFVLLSGILRTFSCGGWVYITSTDDHDAHDVLMISYIVLNVPWMFGTIACTPFQHVHIQRKRRLMATAFFTAMIPMMYFFVQHKVHRIPGAYTHYSFFEWGLIFFDVMFDSAVESELKSADLKLAVGLSLDGNAESNEITVSSEPRHADTKSIENAPLSHLNEKTVQHDGKPQRQDSSPRQGLWRYVFQKTRPALDFCSDLYLSFVYWSILTSLTPTLFYFSVWELGIAGHEFALLSVLSPALLAIPPFMEWCCTRTGRVILHVLSISGLAAYALGSPLHRLLAVTFAAAICNVGAAVDWTGDNSGYQSMLMGLGFMLSSLAKHANHSNNPVWPIVHEQSGGYNKTGALLMCLAIFNYATRPADKPTTHTERDARSIPQEPAQRWLPTAISLGTMLFTLHCLLADPSTLIAWSWTGYPINGPVPHLHGSLTHIAQVLGLSLPVFLGGISPDAPGYLLHPVWFIYGCASSYVMYAFRDWLGYAGGWNFSVFMMSIIPPVLQRVAASRCTAKSFFTAWLVVCIFTVANVFTVAYAFVPGGEIFRERSDMVLFAQMAGLAMVFRWSSRRLRLPSLTLHGPAQSFIRSAIVVLSIASLVVTIYRWPTVVIKPHRPGPRIVRSGIWTVHFGIDNDGRDSQRRIRDLIKDMELDVIGLLETDLHRTVFGNRDLTRVMAEELGFYVDIGPGPNSHTWGAVLLSKFPIVRSTHHLLPSPRGELAPAIEAVLDMYGTEITVLVAHNGQEETPLDRELQATELARIMVESYPRPVIFLGYVVTRPLASRPAPYEIMVTDGRVHDIDEQDWDRWCEYILYRGLYRTSYARVSRSTITDTELQIGQFVVPKYGHGVTDDSHDARYLRAWKEELPEDHWFPLEYYPEMGGKRGHHYHVFNTPLYYKLPEGAVL